MLQGWHSLASVHWRYDPAVVQSLLPDGLVVDTFDGDAWVGLIPFDMRRIRIPGCPSLGGWSTFPETNVRTYVVDPDGRRAVWFFSLDISRVVPAVVARASYGLPYCWSSMSITRHGSDIIEYTTRRRWPRPSSGSGHSPGDSGSSRIVVEIGDPIAEDDLSGLERFVTARWALASTFAGHLVRAQVDHPPWTVHRTRILRCEDTLVTAAGLPAPTGDPLVLWSPGVEVRIARPVWS